MATKNAIRNLLDDDEIGLLDIESEKEIESFVDWSGESGKLSAYLIDKKWIDFVPNGSPNGSPNNILSQSHPGNIKNGGKYYIHKLAENNGYIANYIKLKVSGSKFAKKRWDKKQKESNSYIIPNGSPNGSPNSNVTEHNITEHNITDITTLSSDPLDGDAGSQKNDLIPYKKIIERLNEVYGTQFKITNQNTKNLIKARWNQGFRLDDFEKVMQKKINWKTDDKMVKYCRPQTLFGSKFESYLNEKESEKIEVKKDYGGFV